MKKLFFLSVIAIFLQSCQFFDQKVPSKEELLSKELQQINWKEVDEYPSLPQCDSIHDKEAQKQCFFDYLTHVIQEKLSVEKLSILYPELDTIEVIVTVFPDATLSFEPQFPKDSLAYDTIKIDSILHDKLKDFPKVIPAQKRGIPVKTQFVLPVILQFE